MSRRGDCGSAAMELVVLAPAVLLVLGLVLVGGTLARTQSEVDGAAHTAARAAAAAPARADQIARSVADDVLTGGGRPCAGVEATTTVQPATGGDPAAVRVRYACTVAPAGLELPGLPTRVTLTGTSTVPLAGSP